MRRERVYSAYAGWLGAEDSSEPEAFAFPTSHGDTAHGFFYAQRTVDNRIAIGGRSVPYRYASRTDVDGRVPERTITHLGQTLHAVLPPPAPTLAGARVSGRGIRLIRHYADLHEYRRDGGFNRLKLTISKDGRGDPSAGD